MVVDPFEYLLGTELLLAHFQEEFFHLRTGKTEQIDLLLGCHSILQSDCLVSLYTSLPRQAPWQTVHRLF